MKRAVIYARFSSDKQTEQSIEGQVRECTAFAERNDILIVGTYIDRAISGTTDARPDFQRMLKDAQKQAWDMVLVYKLDRFSRNKYEMAIHRKTLSDNQIALVSATEHIPEGPEGIILESLLEGMAEYYSKELAQKIRRGLRESHLKGNATGGKVTYGYRVENKKYVVDEYEGAIVLRVFEMYASGILIKLIIRILTEEGIYNRDGKPFTPSMIYKMLDNQKYTGVYEHPTEGTYYDLYPQIVPIPLFEQVKALRKYCAKGGLTEDVQYLLKLKMKCGYCGATMITDGGRGKNGSIFRYYSCASKRKKTTPCTKRSVRKETIEKIVLEQTMKAFENPETIERLAADIYALHAQEPEENLAAKALQATLKDVNRKIGNITAAIEEGIITETTKERLRALEEERTALTEKLLAEDSRQRLQISKEDIVRFIKKAINKNPFFMIQTLIKQILIYDDRVIIQYNYTSENPDDDDHRGFCFYTEDIYMDRGKLNFCGSSDVLHFRVELYA